MAVKHDCECSLIKHAQIVPAVEFQYNGIAECYEWMCEDCSDEFKLLDVEKRDSKNDWYSVAGSSTSHTSIDTVTTAAGQSSQLPLNTGGMIGGTRTPLYTPRVCKHHLTPFSWTAQGKSYQVYLSASTDTATKEQGPLPTSCLYLAEAWIRKDSILANFGQWRSEEEPYIVYCEWQDFKTIGLDTARRLTRYAVDALEKGHRFEIGCQGGHGRTGTMLGLLMVATGVAADNAIKDIRIHYCSKAVENKGQEDMIRKFEKEKGD